MSSDHRAPLLLTGSLTRATRCCKNQNNRRMKNREPAVQRGTGLRVCRLGLVRLWRASGGPGADGAQRHRKEGEDGARTGPARGSSTSIRPGLGGGCARPALMAGLAAGWGSGARARTSGASLGSACLINSTLAYVPSPSLSQHTTNHRLTKLLVTSSPNPTVSCCAVGD